MDIILVDRWSPKKGRFTDIVDLVSLAGRDADNNTADTVYINHGR